MADIKKIKDSISYNDVFTLLESLGAEPKYTQDHIESLTICHGGDSHKLYFYESTKQFMCYTHDGSFDVIGLIQKVFNFKLYEALDWLSDRFNISSSNRGGFKNSQIIDTIYNPLTTIKKEIELKPIKSFDDNVLSDFYPLPYIGWIKEGISIRTSNKFEISFDTENNRIIIPHRDVDGRLVGIRARNLDKTTVDKGFKYIPIWHKGIEYKYPTGRNLYGLCQNADVIRNTHQVILFEAEKSVMLMDSMYGNSNAVALNGTMMTNAQMKLLDSFGVNEVIVALDKEFDDINSKEAKRYEQKVASIFEKLLNKYTVSVVWDRYNLLDKKMSPVDNGKEVFEKLMKKRELM